jgi:hypothetical protein
MLRLLLFVIITTWVASSYAAFCTYTASDGSFYNFTDLGMYAFVIFLVSVDFLSRVKGTVRVHESRRYFFL